MGTDTGGALCQILCANYPQLVARLVLTNCDAFDNFPPAVFRAIERAGAHIPGMVTALTCCCAHARCAERYWLQHP